MTNDIVTEPGAGDDRSGSSRRSVLAGLAATGAVAAIPNGVVGRQAETDDEGDGDLETVADFEPPAMPENIAIDSAGTTYLSMGPSGEIRAVDADGNESTFATIETGDAGLLLGITVLGGDLYVANGSGEPETHGVWRVAADSEPERIAELPADETTPNGIIPDPTDSDALLVSDHLGGAIWRVTTDGEAEPWVADESLEPDMSTENPVGADGLAVHPDGDVYVDNLNAGSIVRVPVEDGGAGDPETVVQDEGLVGADGMTFDEEGSLYVAVNARNEIARVTPDHEIETVVAGDDLDFPADVHFGTTEETATSLYIANFAYGTFLQDEAAAEPSLARIDVGVRGHFPGADGDEAASEPTDEGSETAADEAETDGGNSTGDDLAS